MVAFKNRLLRLDFGTLKLQDIGPIDKSIIPDELASPAIYSDPNPQRIGDTFYFVQTQRNGSQLELSQVAVSATTRTDTVLYRGPDLGDENMELTWLEQPDTGTPQNPGYFLITFDGQNNVNVRLLTATGKAVSEKVLYSGKFDKLHYNVWRDPADEFHWIVKGFGVELDGKIDSYSLNGLQWSSKTALPGKIVTFNPNRAVSDPWYTMIVKDKPADVGQETLVNIYTGEVVNAPLPDLRYVGASPDGVWWIYADNDFDTPVANYRIVAYQRTTGTKVTLAEGSIGPTKERSFSWSPSLK